MVGSLASLGRAQPSLSEYPADHHEQMQQQWAQCKGAAAGPLGPLPFLPFPDSPELAKDPALLEHETIIVDSCEH